MRTQTYKQTGIRLPENLIVVLKKKAKSHGISFNAYVEGILTENTKSDVPYINPDEAVNPLLLSMAGTIPEPTRDELDNDPRLAGAFGL